MQAPPPPPSSMPSSSTGVPDVDVTIWRAVAGAAVRVPSVNSYVYYFPQGHLEQCSPAAAVDNYNFTLVRPWFPCQVLSVRYLIDPASDQVLAKILLQPLQPLGLRPRSDDDDGGGLRFGIDDVATFAKVLTRSDANNGGGFSVPRFCADMVLPPLNFAADPPVQTLVMRDLQNHAWEFRHIYRGTPRRHLLTTGWSKFVNAKRLVAGDSVVFMKKRSTGELFIGIRRAQRYAGDGSSDVGAAVAAIESAARGLPFEAVYYPKIGSHDFVVAAEKVKDALRRQWNEGVKVRMTVESDDASRLTWIQGTLASTAASNAGIWNGSPWRSMEVTWEDYETNSQTNENRVSPWQLEPLPLSPFIDPGFPPAKKPKYLQNSGALPAEVKRVLHAVPPAVELNPPIAGSMASSLFYYNPFPPAGMQGARRDDHMLAARPNPAAFNAAYNQLRLVVPPQLPLPLPRIEPEAPVSTVLSMGSSYSDGVSPVSQGSVQSGSGGAVSSIQLFGRTIQTGEDGGGAGGTCEGSSTCGGGCDENRE